jgi:hypothetical protein
VVDRTATREPIVDPVTPFWRPRRKPDEHAAADWWAAGSPLPDAEDRDEGVAYAIAQVLAIRGRRGPQPWPERCAQAEQLIASPRWREAGYRWTPGDEEGTVTDAAGAVVVKLRHDRATNGHVVERFEGGALAELSRFDDHGRVVKR